MNFQFKAVRREDSGVTAKMAEAKRQDEHFNDIVGRLADSHTNQSEYLKVIVGLRQTMNELVASAAASEVSFKKTIATINERHKQQRYEDAVRNRQELIGSLERARKRQATQIVSLLRLRGDNKAAEHIRETFPNDAPVVIKVDLNPNPPKSVVVTAKQKPARKRAKK